MSIVDSSWIIFPVYKNSHYTFYAVSKVAGIIYLFDSLGASISTDDETLVRRGLRPC